jgi:hypothetical protein
MFRRRLGSSALRVVLALDHHSTQPNSTSAFSWKKTNNTHTSSSPEKNHHSTDKQDINSSNYQTTKKNPNTSDLKQDHSHLTTTANITILKTPGSDQFQSPASSSKTRNFKLKIGGSLTEIDQNPLQYRPNCEL